MIEGGVSFGQYSRNIRMNGAFGAGSQLASFALPGESAWTYISTEPSVFIFRVSMDRVVQAHNLFSHSLMRFGISFLHLLSKHIHLQLCLRQRHSWF